MTQQTATPSRERTFSLGERLVVALVGMGMEVFPVGRHNMADSLEAIFHGHLDLLPGCEVMDTEIFGEGWRDWPMLDHEWEDLLGSKYIASWWLAEDDKMWCRLHLRKARRLVRRFAKRDPETVRALLQRGHDIDQYLDWSGSGP